MKITHKFVEFMPQWDEMEYGVVYISIRFKTSSHLCMCGCGEVVVTPIKPNRWRITFDGKTISFMPSVGNCNLECKSHYWIKKNEVDFLRNFTKSECEEEIFYERLSLRKEHKKKRKSIWNLFMKNK
jgi:hypothetical protein